MRKIQLTVTDHTPGGVTTANLVIDSKNIGVLYLEESERTLLERIFTTAAFEMNDEFKLVDADTSNEEEIDLDIFD